MIVMKCRKGYEVEVFSSAAGYYLGTRDEEGFPNCRMSGYYRSREIAQEALDSGKFLVRNCPENAFCNEGKGCFE